MASLSVQGSIAERAGFAVAYRSGLSRLAAQMSGGLGSICMFHSVDANRADSLSPDLRTTPIFLDRLLANLRRAGIDIISIDDLPSRLVSHNDRRFVIMTFDDGFADNFSSALPIFEKYAAPLTVYVSSGFLTRSTTCWWLGLERLLLENDSVAIEAMGRRYHAVSLARKRQTYRECCAWVTDSDDPGRACLLDGTFATYRVPLADLADKAFLNVAQLREFSAHPLVTIGGHTRSHFELARIPEAMAADEIVADKRFLEGVLGSAVLHLAYPFGRPSSCGEREGRLARSAGYVTAVTTWHDEVRRANLADLHLLPRVGSQRNYESLSFMRVQVDGLLAAVKAGFS